MNYSPRRAAAGALLFASTSALLLASLLGRARADPVADRAANNAEARARSLENARGGGPLLGYAQVDRGDLRMTQLFLLTGTAGSFTINASSEIDATSITIQSGGVDETGPLGIFRFLFVGDNPDGFAHDFDVQQPGTSHYAFNTPMQFRVGDVVSWNPESGAPEGLIQITLHGSPPASVAATGVAAR